MKCDFKDCNRSAMGKTCFCGALACTQHFKRARDFCEVCRPAWGPSKNLCRRRRSNNVLKAGSVHPCDVRIPFQTESQHKFIRMGHSNSENI